MFSITGNILLPLVVAILCIQFCSAYVISNDDEKYLLKSLQVGETDLAVRSGVICSNPESDTLRIEGEIIKFSHFLRGDKDCKKIFDNAEIKRVDVFALDQVVIDMDLQAAGRELELSVIAPIWNIDGDRIINLRGLDAKEIDTTAVESKDGAPGLPGSPGGSFLGIAGKTSSSSHLNVDTSGGNGGRGQDGGKGKDSVSGYAGHFSPTVYYQCAFDICRKGLINAKTDEGKIEPFNCIQKNQIVYYGKVRTADYCRIKVFKPLTPAENGGNGGKGGEAGKSGKMFLLQLEGNTNFVRHQAKSFNGQPGMGAEEGKGGSKDGPVEMHDGMRTEPWLKTKWSSPRTFQSEKLSPNGQPGVTGGNTRGMVQATQRIPRSAHAINEYLSFTLKSFRGGSDMKNEYIVQELFVNDSIGLLYDTLTLAEEFQILEENIFFLKDKIDFRPFYQSLLSRISNHAEKTEVQDSLQEKKLLNYLYTAALSKIHNLKDYSVPRMVFDLPGYMRYVKESIDELKVLQDEDNKLKIVVAKMNNVNKYRKQYKAKLDEKILEATRISKEFMPEIARVEKEIEAAMMTLLEEIKDLEHATEEEIKDLEKKKEELKQQLLLKTIFGVINFLATFLIFLGPPGIAAAAVVGTVSGVASSLALSGGTEAPIKEIQESLKTTEKMISALKDAELKRIKKTLEKLSKEANTMPEVLGEVSKKSSELSVRLLSVKKLDEFDDLKGELVQSLDDKRKELTGRVEEKYKKALKIVDKFSKLAQLTASAYDLYETISTDQKKLDNYDKAIAAAKNNLEKLKLLESSFRNIIIPSIEEMEEDFEKVVENLHENSRVALVMTKWNIQSNLKDMKLEIQNAAAALKSSSEIDRVLQKLGDVMDVMINIYDHIQGYEEDKDLADYIADLISVASQDIDMTNIAFEKVRLELDVVISSNLVLQEYGTVMNAFKQFAFPIAHRYFDDLKMPSDLELKSNISELISGAKKQIALLDQKYNLYRSVYFGDTGDCIFNGTFSSDFHVMAPFYKWNMTVDKNTVFELLAGEEVTVMVDLGRSSALLDAIKFKSIKLNFKVKNETLKAEINELLYLLEISMSHLGDSYYRYNNKIYRITTDVIKVEYTFEEHPETHVPLSHSLGWTQVQNGEVMLSPYALWKIQLKEFPVKPSDYLKSIGEYSPENFNSLPQRMLKSVRSTLGLEKYADDILLELVGEGLYMKNYEKPCMEFPVDEYYEPIEILSNKTLVEN